MAWCRVSGINLRLCMGSNKLWVRIWDEHVRSLYKIATPQNTFCLLSTLRISNSVIINSSYSSYNYIVIVTFPEFKLRAVTHWSLTKEKAPTFIHTTRLGSQETRLPSCSPLRTSTSSSAIVKSNTCGSAYTVNMNIERTRSARVILTDQELFISFWKLLYFVTDKYSIKLTGSTRSSASFGSPLMDQLIQTQIQCYSISILTQTWKQPPLFMHRFLQPLTSPVVTPATWMIVSVFS